MNNVLKQDPTNVAQASLELTILPCQGSVLATLSLLVTLVIPATVEYCLALGLIPVMLNTS